MGISHRRPSRTGRALLLFAVVALVLPVAVAAPVVTADEPPAPHFVDVPPDSWFGPAVAWAVSEDITTGFGGGDRFEPNIVANRAQAITFIWRMVGSPTDSPPSGFTDVSPTAFYVDAANWALDVGITTGIGGSPGNPSAIFGGDLPVTRGQFFTMVHRFRGEPEPPFIPAGFVDVPEGVFYDAAANWAAREGITTGFGGTLSFNAAGALTRAQAVTILYRESFILPPEVMATNYSAPGPYKAGFRQLDVDGTRVDIFYPVNPDDVGTGTLVETVSSADAFTPILLALVEDLAPFFIQELDVEFYVEADISDDKPWPILLHSHGFSGDPIYAYQHLMHSATWGYAVVAPSHRTRNLGSFFPPPPAGTANPVQEFVATLDLLADLDLDSDDLFFGALDFHKIAAEGHSAGGGTIRGLVAEGIVPVTLIGHATSFATPAEDDPEQAILLIPGEFDGIIPLSNTVTSYGNQPPPRQMVVIANAGHNPSLDICQPIREQGGLVAPGADLIEELPLFLPLLALGEDGCIDGFLLPGLGYALIRHLTVAQLQWVFGFDSDPQALNEGFLRENFRAATGLVEADLALEPL